MKTFCNCEYFYKKISNLKADSFIEARDQLLVLTDLYSVYPNVVILKDIKKLFMKINTELYPKDFSLWYGLSGIKMISDKIPIELFDNKTERLIEYYIIKESKRKIENFYENNFFKELDMFSGVTGMIRALIKSHNSIYKNQIAILIKDFSNIFITYKNYLNKLFSKCFANSSDLDSKGKTEYIDLSISHGATSCLMVLYLSVRNGYKSEITLEAIKILFSYIHKYIIYKNNEIKNDALIPVLKKIHIDVRGRKYTWCYGTITIIYILSIISNYFNMNEKNEINNILINELNNIKPEYLNNNLFICHGLSGLKLLLILLKELRNYSFIDEKIAIINNKNNLIEFENNKRKNCILTGKLSVLLTRFIEVENIQNSLIYEMLLLK